MFTNPYEQYRSTQIETASPERLLVMLYDAAIGALSGARAAIAGKRREEANRYFLKAQAIITELQGSLDLSVGEVAKSLFALYDYFTRRLIEANLKQDAAGVEEILGHLRDLRSAWKEASVLNATSGRSVSLANVSG
ncbi:MAG: flagellar export chaperone FliS [Bacillota bacterium]